MRHGTFPRVANSWRVYSTFAAIFGSACGRIGYDLKPLDPPPATGGATGGSAQGGMTLGGAAQGGTNLGGTAQGGANLGGTAQGGANLGGTAQGGASLGGAAQGGTSMGGGVNLGGTGGAGNTGPILPTIVWGRLFSSFGDDSAETVGVTPAGDVVVGAHVDSDLTLAPGVVSSGTPDSLIASFSSDNVYQWHRRLSASGTNNFPRDLKVITNGLLVAGEFTGTLTTPAGKLVGIAQSTSYLLKLDLAGTVQSAVHISGGTEVVQPCIAGSWLGVNINTSLKVNAMTLAAGNSFGMAQLNASFAALTQGKVFPGNNGLNGTNDIAGCASAATGEFYLTGQLWESLDFGGGPITTSGGNDSFLAAFSSNGQSLWTKVIGGGATAGAQGRKVELAAQASVLYELTEYSGTLTLGGTATAVGLRDILITGHDPLTGSLKWSLPMGSISNDGIYATALDSSGNLVFSGYHRAAITRGVTPAEGSLSGLGAFLGSVNPAGKLLWIMDLADLTVTDLAVAPNGDIYVVGSTSDALITPSGTLIPQPVDGFLIKLKWP